MSGAPLHWAQVGGGPTFVVSPSHFSAEECPGKLPYVTQQDVTHYLLPRTFCLPTTHKQVDHTPHKIGSTNVIISVATSSIELMYISQNVFSIFILTKGISHAINIAAVFNNDCTFTFIIFILNVGMSLLTRSS